MDYIAVFINNDKNKFCHKEADSHRQRKGVESVFLAERQPIFKFKG